MKFCIGVALVLLSCTAFGGDETGWRWVKAGSVGGKGWNISEGRAEVSIDGTKFAAKLFAQGSTNRVQIVLEGTIKNGRVTAKEEIQESDFTGSVYHGAHEQKKWGEPFAGTTGAESITLSDGWNLIGINRDLH